MCTWPTGRVFKSAKRLLILLLGSLVAFFVIEAAESQKPDPKVQSAIAAHQRRGEECFKAGQFKESVAEFDRMIALRSAIGPHHWQRGISLYYAGDFAGGRKQFESHRAVNPNDVENAVWHFLCVARASGLAQARQNLIPIAGDGRIPMMKIHALFAGKAKPEDVLTETKLGNPSENELKQREFYAHLYLGLYYEALKDSTKVTNHIFKAETLAPVAGYMGDVARVHANLLRHPPTGNAQSATH